MLPNYEFLCEIAHPNVIGNLRYWSHVEHLNEDGSETRSLNRDADGELADEIRTKIIWSLAWSAGSLRNAFTLIHIGLEALLGKLKGLEKQAL